MAANMRNAICVRTQTSKVPTRVVLLSLSLFKQEVNMKRLMTVLNDLGKCCGHAFGKLWLWPLPYIPNSPALLTKNTIKSNSIGYLKKSYTLSQLCAKFQGNSLNIVILLKAFVLLL
jgi:hypothetical protein